MKPGSLARMRHRKWQANTRLTEQQVRALHKLHIEGGYSLRELARRGWRTWGYSSENSALNCICALLDSLGLPKRDRINATVQASTTHGRASRNNKAAYKRWHRATYGPWPSDAKRKAT